MWFKPGKKRNRRLQRNFVLEVKQRSDVVRAKRARLSLMAGLVAAGTFLGIYLVWSIGGAALDLLVYRNPDFAVQQVEVQTDGKIAAAEIRRWSGVKVGMNLIGLDLMAVKRNLEKVSIIESVSVDRRLPKTLVIRVTEREPLAQVMVPRNRGAGEVAWTVYQLDASGMVMQPLDANELVAPLVAANVPLPVITGANVYLLHLGARVEPKESPQVSAALQLIAAFGKSPMAGLVDLRSVDVASPGVLVVTTGQGAEITFGRENFEQQLRRWRGIYDYGKRANKGDIARADLAVANNVPVRWTLASAAPLPPPQVRPKTSPNSKYRRKNV
jgi:cell division septal protein FtsQ